MTEYLNQVNNTSINEKNVSSFINEIMETNGLVPLYKTLQEKQEIKDLISSSVRQSAKYNKIATNVLVEKHSLPSFKEWSNSDFSYNKNNIINSPVLDSFVSKILKSYFWLNPLTASQGKRSSRTKIRFKRLSLNRILSSKPEIKQTNNKTVITVYVYNRNKKYSYFKLNELRIKKDRKNSATLSAKKIITLNDKINNRPSAKKIKKINLKNKKIRLIKRKSLSFLKNLNKHKYLFMKAFKLNNKYFNFYKDKHFNSYLKKLYKREMLYLYYIKIISINNVKYKNWFLLGLKNIISSIYKKNVEFNIVNMKYLHYNSNVLTEAVSIKLKNRNNRLLRVLKKAIRMIRIPSIDPILYQNKSVHNFDKSNDLISILKDIKYKTVNGVRIEAAGRLSKRLTASRSVFKYKYKGTLKNIESSYGKVSSKISRGHVKQNIQFVKMDSKTRNGAFGLKGWISSF